MRVLIWSQFFWPENFRINELATALQQRGMQVTVLTGKPNYPEGKIFKSYTASGIHSEFYGEVEVIRIPLLPRGRGSTLNLAINYLSFIFSGFLIAPWVFRKKHFDVVFVYATSPLLQALPAILLANLKNAPLFVWVQDLWPESLTATGFVKSRVLLRAVEVAVRYIYRKTDVILIQSEAFRKPVERLVNDPTKILYYPNTAEPMSVTQSAPSNTDLVDMLRNSFSIVFAGNIGIAQSIETIVNAADCLRAHSHIRFFMLGNGSRENWLRKELMHRQLHNVVLVGHLPHSQMPSVFSSATALMLTLKDHPTFANTVPSKLQAYLSAGRPIIACLNGEAARIVTEAKAGIVSPAGDGQALADNILKLTRLSPDERQHLGSNGLQYFKENYEPNRRVAELIEYFQNIVAKNRKAYK